MDLQHPSRVLPCVCHRCYRGWEHSPTTPLAPPGPEALAPGSQPAATRCGALRYTT